MLAVGKIGTTPLIAAVFRAQFAMIDALIAAGVRVNAVMADGYSALCYACIFGSNKEQQDLARQAGITNESMSLRLVNTLIAAGANVNHVVSSRGSSPITMACEHDHPSVVDALIKAGANVNHARPDGTTALGMASQHGFVEIVRLLLAAGANVNHARPDGTTALMVASLGGFVEIVRLLLAAGADPRISDTRGRSALIMAKHFNHTAVVALLEARLAELAGSA